MNDAVNARTSGERKERRGFASMTPEKQREIASKGGRAAHTKGTAHEWTSEEARSAGRKGGMISRGGRGRPVSRRRPQPPAPRGRAAPPGPVAPPAPTSGTISGRYRYDGRAARLRPPGPHAAPAPRSRPPD